MIECFHRQLKAALRACPDQQRWSEYVPIVLLGYRAAIKEDLGYSPAELVYGVPLCLPGQIQKLIDLTATDPALFVNFVNLLTMNPWLQTTKYLYPKDITFWIHVFLRKDAVRTPLTPPYTGPYGVLASKDKLFTLDVRVGKKETVSVDRVKRAFTDTATQKH